MENYDPKFRDIARDGDILLGGYNFGTGSSREQAATAILVANPGPQCPLLTPLLSLTRLESKYTHGHGRLLR